MERYEPDELPNCSTPRFEYYATYVALATQLAVLRQMWITYATNPKASTVAVLTSAIIMCDLRASG